MEPITKERTAEEAATRLGREGDAWSNTVSCLLNRIHIDAKGDRPHAAAEQTYYTEVASALDTLPEDWTVARSEDRPGIVEYGIRAPDGRGVFVVARRLGAVISFEQGRQADAAAVRTVAVALRVAAADADRKL